MKWKMLQMFSNFMSVASCDPHSLHLQADNRTAVRISCLCGLLQFFFLFFYQFSLYSSGHQIFLCVFELFHVAEKCLMLLCPGNKSSVLREQTHLKPGITRPFFFVVALLITHDLNQLFIPQSFHLWLRRAATLLLDNVEKQWLFLIKEAC